jgi:hypothetical protein
MTEDKQTSIDEKVADYVFRTFDKKNREECLQSIRQYIDDNWRTIAPDIVDSMLEGFKDLSRDDTTSLPALYKNITIEPAGKNRKTTAKVDNRSIDINQLKTVKKSINDIVLKTAAGMSSDDVKQHSSSSMDSSNEEHRSKKEEIHNRLASDEFSDIIARFKRLSGNEQ